MDILYTYIKNNIKNFSEETTLYLFDEILSKDRYFDPSSINDKGFYLLYEVFEKINANKIKEDYDEDDDEDDSINDSHTFEIYDGEIPDSSDYDDDIDEDDDDLSDKFFS